MTWFFLVNGIVKLVSEINVKKKWLTTYIIMVNWVVKLVNE
jgi:hypothetical protein